MHGAPRPEGYPFPADYSHAAVAYAVTVGDMAYPTKCEACGITADELPPPKERGSALVWHHWSALPEHALDVIGLCRKCHIHVHHGTIPEPRTGHVYRRPTDWRQDNSGPVVDRITPKWARRVAEIQHLLGAAPDKDTAAETKVPIYVISAARRLAGIPLCMPVRPGALFHRTFPALTLDATGRKVLDSRGQVVAVIDPDGALDPATCAAVTSLLTHGEELLASIDAGIEMVKRWSLNHSSFRRLANARAAVTKGKARGGTS